MKRISLTGLVALFLALTSIAFLASAGGPVVGKRGVYDPIIGDGTVKLIVANTSASSQANLTTRFFSLDGEELITSTKQLNSHGAAAINPSTSTLPDWMGFMTMDADQTLASVTEITWEDGSADDDVTAGAYTGYDAGAEDAYLPFVVYAPGAQFTRIRVQNTDTSTATLSMSYINRDGDTDFVITDTLTSGAARTYDTHIPGPRTPDLMSTTYADTNDFWGGGLQITSTADIAAVATNHWKQWSVAYNGLSEGATKNYVPSVERRFTISGTETIWQGFSVIIAQCMETDSSCNVRIKYTDTPTGTVALTLTKTLAAGASLGANTKGGGDWDPNDFSDLESPWVGSAIVETLNSKDLAVISYSIRGDSERAVATSAASTTTASTSIFLPAIYQVSSACPGTDSSWEQWSLIRLQNPGTAAATDVNMHYYSRNGVEKDSEFDLNIAPGKSLNRNTKVNCDDLDLGLNWAGSVYITSTQPLVAVVETLWPDKMSGYNGIPSQ